MQFSRPERLFPRFIIVFLTLFSLISPGFTQSRPQRPEPANTGSEKKNQRPTPKTEEELRKEAEQKKIEEMEKNAEKSDEVISVDTNIVNVDAVVFSKKTGQIITGLKKENFAIFENGIRQDISSFATPESPITVTMVLEYSKWTETFGRPSGGVFQSGVMEVVRPAA